MESSGNTAEEILSNFEDKALDYAARNNQKLYDPSRGMGVGFAPDKIEYFRDHVISVNPNLFGNMNNLAECTLFYWLDSFNISNPNEILVKNLLMRIATHLPEEKITERMTQYTALYNDFMKETGGNLMQIHVHKSIVDEISYASWMKGIPILLDKDTHTLATRGSNSKPVPVLTDRDNNYERPKTSDYLDLLTQDPDQFIEKYSDFSNRKVVKKHDLDECLDRPQARIVVNPSYFNNPDLVKVDHYTRFKASDEALNNYQQKLKSFIQEDMAAYLKQLQAGGIKGQSGDPLTKLTKYIEEGTEFDFNTEQAKITQISQIEREE